MSQVGPGRAATARWPQAGWLLRLMTALALVVGLVTLVMLWIGLLGSPIDWRVTSLIAGVIGLIIWGVARRSPPAGRSRGHAPATPPPLLIVRLAMLVIVGIGSLIVLNATLWPFYLDDAMSIYGYWGKHIALTGALPRGSLYEAYPQLLQLSYAFVRQASGWNNDFLAGLTPALLSVGVMGAAFWIGQEVDDWRTGLVAALLVALTPTYTAWASSGYADLPAGFFYMLAVVYVLRWERDGRLLDALLAGMMAGLAAWTKNTALIVLPTLLLRGVYMLWYTRRPPNWRGVALIMVAALLVAAPWYVRALLTAGVIVPPTAWADRALRTPASLLPYWMTPTFGVAGLAFTVGVLYALWRVIRARGRDPGTAALLIFYLPYFGAWWWLASYDSRFLLTVIGCVAVMGAQACRALWARLDPDGAWLRQRAVQGVAALAVIVLAAPVAFNTLDFKADLWRNPLMSVEERFRTVHGGRYLMARHISAALPPGSRLWVQDNRLPFLIDGMQCVVGGWPSAAAQLAGMHYWVISPSDALPEWFTPAFGSADPLFEADGYRLFALTPP